MREVVDIKRCTRKETKVSCTTNQQDHPVSYILRLQGTTKSNLSHLILVIDEAPADNGDTESIDSMARGIFNSKCKIHQTEDIKAFCKDDLCSICFKCLLGEHRNHDIVMLDELTVEDLQGKVNQFQDKIED